MSCLSTVLQTVSDPHTVKQLSQTGTNWCSIISYRSLLADLLYIHHGAEPDRTRLESVCRNTLRWNFQDIWWWDVPAGSLSLTQRRRSAAGLLLLIPNACGVYLSVIVPLQAPLYILAPYKCQSDTVQVFCNIPRELCVDTLEPRADPPAVCSLSVTSLHPLSYHTKCPWNILTIK